MCVRRSTQTWKRQISILSLTVERFLAAAASSVPRAMVENQHREANIELSGEIGQAFVRFIYTLDETLLKDQAVAFLELGELKELQELKGTSERELLKQLDKETMVRLLSIGEVFHAEELFEAALYLTRPTFHGFGVR